MTKFRVVIDTSVLISGVYNPAGRPADVLALARNKIIQNVTSPFILEELKRILRDKFYWEKDKIERIAVWIQSFSQIVFPKEALEVISHKPDNRILECALAGEAHFIVSGDHHLTDLKEYQGISILNPADFLEATKSTSY